MSSQGKYCQLKRYYFLSIFTQANQTKTLNNPTVNGEPVNGTRIFPLSENALTVDFGNRIDVTLNRQVLVLAEAIDRQPFAGLAELVPAYGSLTVFYDVWTVRKDNPTFPTAWAAMQAKVETYLADCKNYSFDDKIVSPRIIKLPVCYNLESGWDWDDVCRHTGLSREEVIRRHTAATYRVYMMGFLPGFAYLGGLDETIAVPRKAQPRTQVEAGSVGIAGQQTGVYPLNSPGGWQIIGKTSVKLFDKTAPNPVLLQAGDQVRFYEFNG